MVVQLCILIRIRFCALVFVLRRGEPLVKEAAVIVRPCNARKLDVLQHIRQSSIATLIAALAARQHGRVSRAQEDLEPVGATA